MTLEDSLGNLPPRKMSEFLCEMSLEELRQALAWEQENLPEAQEQTEAQRKALAERKAFQEARGEKGVPASALFVGESTHRVKWVIRQIEEEIKRREIKAKYMRPEHPSAQRAEAGGAADEKGASRTVPDSTPDTPKGFKGLGAKKTDLSKMLNQAVLTTRQRDVLSLRLEYALPWSAVRCLMHYVQQARPDIRIEPDV